MKITDRKITQKQICILDPVMPIGPISRNMVSRQAAVGDEAVLVKQLVEWLLAQ
jgi:hypothetical protein